MERMQVCALVSGGKDSICAALNAAAWGHRIVALANLYSAESAELDSWMYQTVGTDSVGTFASALELPLYRTPIAPATVAHQTDAVLVARVELNEVELLYTLLYAVKCDFPELRAVCSGAILSSYQRLRVEHVCARLGLISLSPLWERDQDELLQEMIECPIDAVLVKVAALGLDSRHLGRSIATLQPHLRNLANKFGINVCGEGGEYESFVLDCPMFKRRLVIEESEVIEHDSSAFAAVSYLLLKKIKLEQKDGATTHFEPVIIAVDPNLRHNIPSAIVPENKFREFDSGPPLLSVRSPPTSPLISTSTYGLRVDSTMSTWSPEDEALFNLLAIQKALASVDVPLTRVLHVNVYVRDMAQFAAMNKAFATMFPSSPPSRATVAVEWPRCEADPVMDSWADRNLFIDCIAFRIDRIAPEISNPHSVLHVQSVSTWAPACIGPYAQANTLQLSLSDKFASLAGQIALNPATMSLKDGESAREQLVKASAHQTAVMAVTRLNDAHFLRQIVFTTESELIDDDIPTLKSRVTLKVPALPRSAAAEIQSYLIHCPKEAHQEAILDLKEATTSSVVYSEHISCVNMELDDLTSTASLKALLTRFAASAVLSLTVYHEISIPQTKILNLLNSFCIEKGEDLMSAVTLVAVSAVNGGHSRLLCSVLFCQ